MSADNLNIELEQDEEESNSNKNQNENQTTNNDKAIIIGRPGRSDSDSKNSKKLRNTKTAASNSNTNLCNNNNIKNNYNLMSNIYNNKSEINNNNTMKLQGSVNLQTNYKNHKNKYNKINNNNEIKQGNIDHNENDKKIESLVLKNKIFEVESSENTVRKCKCLCEFSDDSFESKLASNLKNNNNTTTNTIASTLQPTKESQTHYKNHSSFAISATKDEINNLPKSKTDSSTNITDFDSLFDTSITDNYQICSEEKILSNLLNLNCYFDDDEDDNSVSSKIRHQNNNNYNNKNEGFNKNHQLAINFTTNISANNHQNEKYLQKIKTMVDAINEVREFNSQIENNNFAEPIVILNNYYKNKIDNNNYNNLVSPSSNNISRLRQDPIGQEDKMEKYHRSYGKLPDYLNSSSSNSNSNSSSNRSSLQQNINLSSKSTSKEFSSILSRQDPVGSEDDSYRRYRPSSNLLSVDKNLSFDLQNVRNSTNNFSNDSQKTSLLRKDPIGMANKEVSIGRTAETAVNQNSNFRTRLSKNSQKQQQKQHQNEDHDHQNHDYHRHHHRKENQKLDNTKGEKKLSNFVQTRQLQNQVKPNKNKNFAINHQKEKRIQTHQSEKLISNEKPSVNQVLANEYISKYLGPSLKNSTTGLSSSISNNSNTNYYNSPRRVYYPRIQSSTQYSQNNSSLLLNSSPAATNCTTSSGQDSGLPKEKSSSDHSSLSNIKNNKNKNYKNYRLKKNYHKSISRAEQILQAKLEQQLKLEIDDRTVRDKSYL